MDESHIAEALEKLYAMDYEASTFLFVLGLEMNFLWEKVLVVLCNLMFYWKYCAVSLMMPVHLLEGGANVVNRTPFVISSKCVLRAYFFFLHVGDGEFCIALEN